MSTTTQESVSTPTAQVDREVSAAADTSAVPQDETTDNQTRPAGILTEVQEISDGRQRSIYPPTSETPPQPRQPDSTASPERARTTDLPEPPADDTADQETPTQTDAATEMPQPTPEPESTPSTDSLPVDDSAAASTETVPSTGSPPTDTSTATSTEADPTTEQAEPSTADESQTSEPESTLPPPKPDVPEWVTWEDDITAPTVEELEEVKDTEVENDATNIAAREKQVFTEYDDPDQRPVKKIRMSWIIRGVRGTRERPNRARTMHSPPAYIDGLYWTIKFFPRGNKCASVSAYIQCSREKPQPDKEVPESTFTYFEGPPDADLGQTAEPVKRIKVEATPLIKPEEKVKPEETNKEASASNDSCRNDDDTKESTEFTLSEKEKDFRLSAQLGMVLYNPEEPRTATCHTSEHQFCPKNSDWGWTNFIGRWDNIHVRKQGERQALLKNDTIGIDAYVRVFDDPTEALWWHGSHDNESSWPSKLLAGYHPMGTPPLYHSPAVAGLTAWLLLAPIREVLQKVDTGGWRSHSQVKPRPFIARLQAVLHQMRHLKNEEYVNVHPAIEQLLGAGEDYNDVKSFWEVARRGIELELEGETEALQKLANIFDVSGRKYSLPPLPVRGVGDIQTALSKLQQSSDLPASSPELLPLMLEREAFDKVSSEWKMHHDRVTLNEEINLPFGDNTKYSLYGFVVHIGTRNSGRFYSVLRPNGPGTKWLAFEDGDGNKVFSYTRTDLSEYEGLVASDLDSFTSTRQTAYMALYVKTDCLQGYLPGKLEDYTAPEWLKKAADLDTDGQAQEAKEEISPKSDHVAFEVFHDECSIGRQGLLDMFNIKQFPVNRGSFHNWALPSRTTIQELRQHLSASMGLDKPERLRILQMSFGEVGQYGNAMWSQLTLNATLASIASDVKPLCLWTSTLQTDEEIKLYKMPEPVIGETSAEVSRFEDQATEGQAAEAESNEGQAGEGQSNEPAPVLGSTEGSIEEPTTHSPEMEAVPQQVDVAAIEPTNTEAPATSEAIGSTVQPAQGDDLSNAPTANPGAEQQTTIAPPTDPTAEQSPTDIAPTETDVQQPTSDASPTDPTIQQSTTEVTTPSEPDAFTQATDTQLLNGPTTTASPATADSAAHAEAQPDIESTDRSTSELSIDTTIGTDQTQEQFPEEAADQSTETASTPLTSQPVAEVVSPPAVGAAEAEIQPAVIRELEEPLAVEHGHLFEAFTTESNTHNGSALVEQVVALVVEAQAAVVQHETSAEDEAAIAAVIAADAAALSDSSAQENQPPVEGSPVVEDSAPPATEPVEANVDETAESAERPERGEVEAPEPCVYGFIQLFDPGNQTFKVFSTFFAPRHAPVRAHIRSLLKYEGDRLLNIWYRTATVDGAAVGDNETFSDICFVDGVDVIVGPVLPEDMVAEMRAAGQYWEPFGLSRFLRMRERNHPHAITTEEGATIELAEFGGKYYKGPLVNGRQHGASCELVYANGQTYSGPMTCNLRQGERGSMIYQNGDKYEGGWHEDEQHGQGTFIQKRTGNKYVGGFLHGKRWGKGTTFWEVADEEADLCQICYGEEIDALFFDCGHVCSCMECAKQCDSCPICRRSVKQVVRMYRV